MSTPPTAALFDIGNVLVHVDFETGLGKLIPPDAENPTERMRGLLEKKDDLESGALSGQDFIPWASERLGFAGSADEFRAAWNSIFEPIHAMWAVASFLKSQRLKMILFSNTNALHAEWLLENYDVFDQFDARIFSHKVGVMKPDPAIYQHAVEHCGLVPGETLYIDDLPENIASGEELGFRCHRYDFAKHHQFVAWLDGQFGMA